MEGVSEDSVLVTMPAWTPGSYRIQDFARNLRLLKARSRENEMIEILRKDKSSWKIINGNHKNFIVSYEVYAGELAVQTSHLDSTHGYLNGTSVFMYIEGYKDQSVELMVKPFGEWKISTGLEKIGENKYRATNYDILVDSPMEIGTHRSLTFTVDNKEHEIAIYGKGNEEPELIVQDTKRIVESYKEQFGSLPYKRYVFIIHLLDNQKGGLEHLNSTTIQSDRFQFSPRKKYIEFLSTVSHEYFHLWNVKRIRPIELMPFNYKEENYTTLLWVSEGITAFYEWIHLYRAKIVTEVEYFKHLLEYIRFYDLLPGSRYESASDSSFDSWTKMYRDSPNNLNSYTSYYLKGEILGFMINARITEHTKGQKTLDDVFRLLFDKYNRDGKGFTEKDFLNALHEISGLDFTPFFSKYVRGVETIDFDTELKRIGYKIVRSYSKNDDDDVKEKGFLGIICSSSNGRIIVEGVIENSPAQKAGLYPKDEIIAINKFRFTDRYLSPIRSDLTVRKIDNLIEMKPGEKVSIDAFRSGLLLHSEATLGKAPYDRYEIINDPEGDANCAKYKEKLING
ncbi:peptidase M61 domain-containing protein [mine drainage metagenome]|uniref:Peptidase M61 domain-containing protein n=1 Tax=mine drainage metagenome TaxID=410659 RepID=T0YP22_9ZZZZ